MMLKRSTHETKPKKGFSSRLVQAGLASVLAVASAAGLATGCLDRKVVPATPTTSNVFVDQIVQTAVDKIDLLFMIDNSVSMADKQDILADAVPVLLRRLVTPICLDGNGNSTNPASNADANGQCPDTKNSPEFPPIGDIHIGIVSSSLGAHGGSVCSAPSPNDPPDVHEHLDDKGELIGAPNSRPEATVTTWNNSGFLAWDPSQTKDNPPGLNNPDTLTTQFTSLIQAVGEHGCGYEASLEAWYRFLVDPEPPASVAKMNGVTVKSGSDDTLKAQRAAFLRPDSLVAVIMLSDENDCSIRDDGVGWFVGATSHMPKASQACAGNPNDPCCRSCAQVENSPPSGCMPLTADPVCMGAATGSYNTWDTLNDSLNLRCYNQKQRFGFDLLYPTSRYVNGLTQSVIARDSDGMGVTNPLYDPGNSGKAPRDPSLVFLAGIVGVPWQDISTADSLSSPTQLTYLAASDLLTQGRWSQLLGDVSSDPHAKPGIPTDPFMVESIDPRSGKNPNIDDSIAPATSNSPTTSKINGHEQNIPQKDDLQFACTFPLSMPRTCMPGDSACDCSATAAGDTSAVVAANSPLCQPTGGGMAGTTQNYAKAYPGARELTVLRDFKDNAIVASICPKNTKVTNGGTDKASDPNYGYNPAVAAIIDRLKEALKGKCLPRKIDTDPTTHLVECEVIEAQKAGNCDCTKNGRSEAPSAINPAVFNQLEASGSCGSAAGQTPCDLTGFCLCQINQETNDNGTDLTTCQAGGQPGTAGYCYIDGDNNPDSPALKNCPANQKRVLHFVDAPDGSKTPAQGAIAFIACLGANINDAGTGM